MHIVVGGTALHPGKDLAVSLSPFDEHIPEGTLAFRHRRHCSHLWNYFRRALPATLLPPPILFPNIPRGLFHSQEKIYILYHLETKLVGGSVRTFLPPPISSPNILKGIILFLSKISPL